MNHLRKFSLIFVASLLCFAAPSLTRAGGIPITGSAYVFGSSSAGFSFTGPSLDLSSSTGDWPSFVGGCLIPTAYTFYDGEILEYGSGGTVDGAHAGVLAGYLTFSPCFTVGIAPSQPAKLMGDIYGYKVVYSDSGGYALGSMVFALQIQGTGTLVQPGPNPHDAKVYYTITSGTATLTPEPASLLLFATGLIGLALLMRRRVRRKA